MQQIGQEGDMMEVFGPGHRGYLVLSVLFLELCFSRRVAPAARPALADENQPPAPTVSMNANATQIVAGSSSPLTLTVSASNATQVVISDNCDAQTYTLQATGGTLQPIPAPDYAGHLHLHGDRQRRQQPDGCQQRGYYRAALDGDDRQHDAGQQTIAAGQTGESASHRGECQFRVHHQQRDQREHTGSGSRRNGEGYADTQTTTYTVTATGANNQQVTATATVTILSVSITASPATIVNGNPTNLTVTAANASQVVVTDNI